MFRYAGGTPALQRKAQGDTLKKVTAREIMADCEPSFTAGSCVLQRPEIGGIIQHALLHFEGERYNLSAWCVMPNHIHVVMSPLGSHELSRILHSWKSFTSKEINKILNRNGRLWEPESFTHLIRSVEDLERFITYTEQNPFKAGLCQSAEDWPFSSCSASCSAGVPPASLHSIEFIDPRATPFAPLRCRGKLPHLYKEGGTYFVTFCLADAWGS